METIIIVDGHAKVVHWTRSRTYSDAPKRGGVYALFTSKGECLYVGASADLHARLRLHQSSNVFYRICEQQGMSFVWRYTPAKHEGHEVEIAAALRPRFNTPGDVVRTAMTPSERSERKKDYENARYAERSGHAL